MSYYNIESCTAYMHDAAAAAAPAYACPCSLQTTTLLAAVKLHAAGWLGSFERSVPRSMKHGLVIGKPFFSLQCMHAVGRTASQQLDQSQEYVHADTAVMQCSMNKSNGICFAYSDMSMIKQSTRNIQRSSLHWVPPQRTCGPSFDCGWVCVCGPAFVR